MGTLIYIDTNIYLDYLKKRTNKDGKDLSESAWNIFIRSVMCEFDILISDIVVKELHNNISPEETKTLFVMLKLKLKKVESTKNELNKALEIDNDNTYDILHAILANRCGARYLVTRNISDYRKARHLIIPILPELL